MPSVGLKFAVGTSASGTPARFVSTGFAVGGSGRATSWLKNCVGEPRSYLTPNASTSVRLMKIIFINRTDVEALGVKYDLGSPTQFFNQLVARPDPPTAKPVDTNLAGVPDALVPTANFNPTDGIVDLGGNSLSGLGNADQSLTGGSPALQLIFSTAIGNFTLTSFIQALQRVELSDIQAEPTITTLDNRPAEILVGDRVPI